jgi:hypothetical protein
MMATIGYHPAFVAFQNKIKHEMSELILKTDSKNLQQFSFQIINGKIIGDVKFENENEVIINGKWFDISSKKIENGQLILSVLSDENETAIVNADKAQTLANSTISTNRNHSKKNTPTQNSMSEFVVESSLFFFHTNLSELAFYDCKLQIANCKWNADSPPPKV